MNITSKKRSSLKLLANTITPCKDVKGAGQDEFLDIATHYRNKQICLCDNFRNSMQNLLDSTEFAYPNDAEKIIKLSEDHIESTADMTYYFMNEALSRRVILCKGQAKQNKLWMKEWMEQNDEMKASSEEQMFFEAMSSSLLFYQSAN